MPYHDRRMIGHIQQNLTRAVHAPHVNFSAVKEQAALNNTMQIGLYQIKKMSNKDTVQNSVNFNSNSNGNIAYSKLVNIQFNSPIGLYSSENLEEEINRVK
jgi:hypothetical protein